MRDNYFRGRTPDVLSPESLDPISFSQPSEKSIKPDLILRKGNQVQNNVLRRPVHKRLDISEYEEEKNELISGELD